ncbi:hypothetical protein K3495_g3129 [Podosphaera aphanis]|nr:hypothetical protein K3495_g3129 [Podosphaera aphanis]
MPTLRARLHKASLFHHISSRESSLRRRRRSSILSSWETDEQGFMASTGCPQSTRLFLKIPSNAHTPRRPTLQEILSNVAPPPWNLNAFMAYLSHNHCLETLEFTSDAAKYEKQHNETLTGLSNTLIPNSSPEQLCIMWQNLLDTYIKPNGPREVNLPCDVRDHLLSLPCTLVSPDPAELASAVRIIHELMEESILGPFLNAMSPATSHTPSDQYYSPWTSKDSMSDTVISATRSPLRSHFYSRSLSSSPTSERRFPLSRRDSLPRNSHNANSSNVTLSHPTCRISAFFRSALLTPACAHSYSPIGKEISSSAAPSIHLFTPPSTPPNSEISDAPTPSSEIISSWKKMSAKLSWKKQHSAGPQTSGYSYQISRKLSCDTS